MNNRYWLTVRQVLALCVLSIALAGCWASGAAVATLAPAPTATPAPTPVSPARPWLKRPPAPVSFPEDEAPHDVLTEWWYYTGHLDAKDGARFGFEFVIFQVRMGEGEPTYLSHFAVSDLAHQQFTYDQRMLTGSQPQPPGGGFDLALGDWSMAGRDGRDSVQASIPDYTIDLTLAALKPPSLHLGEGYISFGAAGDSYYYSRTRMAVEGTIADRDGTHAVTGEAWFDHQWGDFINVKGGGWDWYSFQLADQTEIMLFVVRDPAGVNVIRYGSAVSAEGITTDLLPDDIGIEATGTWTSPHSGATYPSGWRVRLPTQDLVLDVTPAMSDQELDTRPTTGIIYWEGAVEITGTRAGQPLVGRGYIELTGYAP